MNRATLPRIVQSEQSARADNAITGHFEEWSADYASEAKDKVLATAQSPGWPIIGEAIDLEIVEIRERLAMLAGAEDFSTRGRVLQGQIIGLETVSRLVDGIILQGEEAEQSD